MLSDDALEFYKKKTDRSPKGMIPLKGATLNSPCQDFGKRTVRQPDHQLDPHKLQLPSQRKSFIQLVFKITTEKKQDHFFQASHVEEREHWVKDIRRAITCIQGGRKFARKSTRRSIRLPDKVNLRFCQKNSNSLYRVEILTVAKLIL